MSSRIRYGEKFRITARHRIVKGQKPCVDHNGQISKCRTRIESGFHNSESIGYNKQPSPVCKYCWLKLPSLKYLQNHEREHKKQKQPFLCLACGENFETAYRLAKHSHTVKQLDENQVALDEEKMERGSEDKGSASVMDPHLNLQQHHQQLQALQEHLQQPQCHSHEDEYAQQLHAQPQQSQEQNHVPEHMQQHNDQQNQWRQCAKCSLKLPPNHLQVHLIECFSSIGLKPDGELEVGSTALFVCSVCEKVCPDLACLREHGKSHSGQSVTAEIHAAKNHTTETHTKQNATWNQPLARFTFSPSKVTGYDLEEHVPIETQQHDAQNVCPVCGKLFQQLGHLLQHLDTHQHIKACPCGQIFAIKQEFKDHQEVCMPVLRDPTAATISGKSYKCRLCPKVFGTVQSRLQHERIHKRVAVQGAFGDSILAKKLLVCQLCKQEFNFKENYRAHIRSHTGEKPYTCRHCPKSFSSLQGRWQHERIHKR